MIEPVKIQAVHVFKVSFSVAAGSGDTGAEAETENVIVNLVSDSGVAGWGSASPATDATGETMQETIDAINGPLASTLRELPERPIRAILETIRTAAPNAPAARAAFDIAVHDIWSKLLSTSLIALLGPSRYEADTSFTVDSSDPTTAIMQAGDMLGSGFSAIRLAGGNHNADIDCVRGLRKDYGKNVTIRLDARGKYSPEETEEVLKEISSDISILEQPVDKDDIDTLAQISKDSPVPIAADESVTAAHSAYEVFEKGIPLVTVKLMKCGGLDAAVRISNTARAMGREIIVSCDDETSISMAAACHFALSTPLLRHADLGAFGRQERFVVSSGIRVRDGVMSVAQREGLGLEVRKNLLRS